MARPARGDSGCSPLSGDKSVVDTTRRYVSGRVLASRVPPEHRKAKSMGTNKLWQLPVVGRLGVQHGLLVGWFLLVAVLAVLLLPGPAGSANAPGSLVEAQTATVDFGGQNHCGIVVGIGASFGGSGSGDTRCASVEAGGNAQVNTDGFGDIGMQFQNSPVNAPITNVHISNEGNNNSNNTVVGDNNVIINANLGITINA